MAGERQTDFSVSINPLGLPLSAQRALLRALPSVGRYPDVACRALVDCLAARHKVQPDQVVVGNGSNDLIYAVARALYPRRAAIVEPTYTEYFRACLLVGATVDHWLEDDEHFHAKPFDPEKADVVWLCHPNNPTGQLWSRPILSEWVAAFPRVTFVVDEAFLPFRHDEIDYSMIGMLDKLPNLAVLRSLTKLYALPGLRLGYALASPDLAARLRAQVPPWSVNVLAQEAGLAAVQDEAFLDETRAWLKRERAIFREQLAGLQAGLAVIPSGANFFLVRLCRVTAAFLARKLADRGIAVRDASNFIGLDARYVRMAVRTFPDNQRLLVGLRSVLGEG